MKICSPQNAVGVLLVAVILGALTLPVQSATLTLPIQNYQVLAGEKGTTGILIDVGSLDTLAGSKILYAKCYLNIAVDSCSESDDGLDGKALVAQWPAVATGTVDLTDSSGALSSFTFTAGANIGRGANGDTEILVTELVKAWVEGHMVNNGFVLLPRTTGCSHELFAKAAYPGNGYGKLLVKFVRKTR